MSTPHPKFSFPVGGEDLEVSGWAAIEQIFAGDMKQAQLAQQLDHATMYSQAFATDAGRYVLKDLIEQFMRKQIVQPGAEPKDDALRQGACNVVINILGLIEFANTGGGQPPIEE